MAATKIRGVKEDSFDSQAEAREVPGVAQKSESEPVVVEGLSRSMAFAGKVKERWTERQKKDGTIQWFCPMETGKRTHFLTKAECQTFMNATFKARLEQAKLEKLPKSKWTPQKERVSPKRQMSDYVPPEYAHLAVVSTATRDRVQNLGRMARKIAGKGMTAGVLVGMMESEAINRIKDLDNAELQRTTCQSSYRSKNRLYRACQAECKQRGLVVAV